MRVPEWASANASTFITASWWHSRSGSRVTHALFSRMLASVIGALR
jgi:hypothetical protein